MPGKNGLLPPAAQAALDEYLAALDAALPGVARGIYITGSAVLGDWQPGRSDLDILTVTEGTLGDAELATLDALHAGIPGRPYRDAIYIPADDVGMRADTGTSAGAGRGRGTGAGTASDVRYPSAIDGVFQQPARYRPDPVLWATLHRHGLTVRGPAASTLGTDPAEDWLLAWNQENLTAYWRPWAERVRGHLADHDADEPTPAGIVPWGALGPGRLHATITTGQIISKSASADYTARLLPQYADLLARSKRHRSGDDGQVFTVADARDACDLIDVVVEFAAGLRSRNGGVPGGR